MKTKKSTKGTKKPRNGRSSTARATASKGGKTSAAKTCPECDEPHDGTREVCDECQEHLDNDEAMNDDLFEQDLQSGYYESEDGDDPDEDNLGDSDE